MMHSTPAPTRWKRTWPQPVKSFFLPADRCPCQKLDSHPARSRPSCCLRHPPAAPWSRSGQGHVNACLL